MKYEAHPRVYSFLTNEGLIIWKEYRLLMSNMAESLITTVEYLIIEDAAVFSI